MSARITRVALAAALVVAGFTAGAFYTRHDGSGSAAGGRQIQRYLCPMHPDFIREDPGTCAICGMDLVPMSADEGADGGDDDGAPSLPPGVVRVSPDKQQVSGVQLGEVTREPQTRVLRTAGRVETDETRVYKLTAAIDGWIDTAQPNSVGSLVEKDEVLATFYGREFLGAQQAYLYALDARDRFLQQNAGEAQMASTDVQVQSSIDNLLSLGMTRLQIEEIARTRTRVYNIDLRAPATGFILLRNVSPGQRFDSGEELYQIADLSHVWVLADLFEQEARHVKAGRPARIRYQGEIVETRVSSVLPIFDADARTLKARLELDNPGYRLRPGMFVDVEFPIELPETLTVPAGAVIDSGLTNTVFVDRGNGFFEPRHVETGWRFDDRVEIVRGLMEGERIVVSGAFLIDSESRMRAATMGVRSEPARDPVCGMDMDRVQAEAAGLVLDHEGQRVYFCSSMCRDRFAADPAKFRK